MSESTSASNVWRWLGENQRQLAALAVLCPALWWGYQRLREDLRATVHIAVAEALLDVHAREAAVVTELAVHDERLAYLKERADKYDRTCACPIKSSP